jgi:methyltransferase (TIGR00027 family)
MTEPTPLLRNVSDTALWVAMYRAQESDRPDALFCDPFARRLAGERGEQILNTLAGQKGNAWAFVTRTFLFDSFVTEQVRQGVDLVINLAAGLDARPYRMSLPPSLQWVEVDLPDLVDYKEEILKDETPVCRLERVRLNLADGNARRSLFEELGRRAGKAMILSEGLLVYLTAEEVGWLAQDLAAPPSFRTWATDLASPGLVRMLQKQVGAHLNKASSPLKFGPEEGPGFFARYGWKPVEVRSMIKSAARLKRAPFMVRLIARLPESNGRQGSRPWSAVCLFER